MTHEDQHILDRFRAATRCEICFDPLPRADPFHIIAAGMSSGRRLDVTINILGSCRWCHTLHHDGNLEYKGRRMREPDLFEIVHHREKIPLDVDLQAVLWMILRLPKDASQTRIRSEVATMNEFDQPYAWQTLREMKKVA